ASRRSGWRRRHGKTRSGGRPTRAPISVCSGSSGLTPTGGRGGWRGSMIPPSFVPTEPVPPVTRTEVSRQFTAPPSIAGIAASRLLPDRPQRGQEMEVELARARIQVSRVPEHDLEVRRDVAGLDQSLAGA